MVSISKRVGQASDLVDVTPSLSEGRAYAKKACNLENYVASYVIVKQRLDDERLPWHNIDGIDDEPREDILENMPGIILRASKVSQDIDYVNHMCDVKEDVPRWR